MTTDEINEALVSQVFSTDGPLENQITNLLMEYDETTRCTIMKHYIYFKAYVMDQITHQLTMSASAYSEYKVQLHYVYERYIAAHQREFKEKHLEIDFGEMSFMLDRFERTGYKVKDCLDIVLRNVDDSVQADRKICGKLRHIMSMTYNSMRMKGMHEQNGLVFNRTAYMCIIVIAIIVIILAFYYI